MQPDRVNMVIEETVRFFQQLRERHKDIPIIDFCSNLGFSLTLYQSEVFGSQIQRPAQVRQPSLTHSRASYSSTALSSYFQPQSSENCQIQSRELIQQKPEEIEVICSQELEIGLIQTSKEGSHAITTSIMNIPSQSLLREMGPKTFQTHTASMTFSPIKKKESFIQIAHRQPEQKKQMKYAQQSFTFSSERSGYQVGPYFSPLVLNYAWKLLVNTVTGNKEKIVFPKEDLDMKLKVSVIIVENGNLFNESRDCKTFNKIQPLSISLPSHIHIASRTKDGAAYLSLEDLPNITICFEIFYKLSVFSPDWDSKKQGLIILTLNEQVKQLFQIFPDQIAAKGWKKADIYNMIAKKVGLIQAGDIFENPMVQIRTFEAHTAFINMKGAERISRKNWSFK